MSFALRGTYSKSGLTFWATGSVHATKKSDVVWRSSGWKPMDLK